MSLSLDDFADLLGEGNEETDESLGDRLSGTVDADVDSVESVREVRIRV
jgi:hypothetical protein